MKSRLADIREGYFLFRGQEDQSAVMGTATAAVAQLWSEAFQPNVVQVDMQRGPVFSNGVSALDITALQSDDGATLSVIMTNATKSPASVQVNLSGHTGGSAALLTVSGNSLSDNNSWKEPQKVSLKRSTVSVNDPAFMLDVPAYSVQALLIGSAQ